MSDMFLKFFFIALNSKTDWTLQNLPTEIVNKNMERFNLHLQSPRLWPDRKFSQKKEEQPTYHNPAHIYVSKNRAQHMLTVNTGY